MVCKILFGIPYQKMQHELEIINFILLLGKWYINKTKTNKQPLYLISFLELLHNKIIWIQQANKMQDRPDKEWQIMLGNLF